MTAVCEFPDCGRSVFGHGLCAGHYQQRRRNTPLRPLREESEQSAQVSFRCSAELKARVARAAEREGIDPTEWWRLAAAQRLKKPA